MVIKYKAVGKDGTVLMKLARQRRVVVCIEAVVAFGGSNGLIALANSWKGKTMAWIHKECREHSMTFEHTPE